MATGRPGSIRVYIVHKNSTLKCGREKFKTNCENVRVDKNQIWSAHLVLLLNNRQHFGPGA